MKGQVFLGGACGNTTWRQDIAIPALEAAGITYFNPQLGVGEWSAHREAADMRAKDEADVLLFVISDQTRAVASIAEVAYLIGTHRSLALVINDINDDCIVDGQIVSQEERDDLNRGRLFVRTMAKEHGIAVYKDVESAVQHAVDLVKASETSLSLNELRRIISDLSFKQHQFVVEPTE